MGCKVSKPIPRTGLSSSGSISTPFSLVILPFNPFALLSAVVKMGLASKNAALVAASCFSIGITNSTKAMMWIVGNAIFNERIKGRFMTTIYFHGLLRVSCQVQR